CHFRPTDAVSVRIGHVAGCPDLPVSKHRVDQVRWLDVDLLGAARLRRILRRTVRFVARHLDEAEFGHYGRAGWERDSLYPEQSSSIRSSHAGLADEVADGGGSKRSRRLPERGHGPVVHKLAGNEG